MAGSVNKDMLIGNLGKTPAAEAMEEFNGDCDLSGHDGVQKCYSFRITKKSCETIREGLSLLAAAQSGKVKLLERETTDELIISAHSRMEIDERIARKILEYFGGAEANVTIQWWSEGHSGPGFYIWCSDYLSDGSAYLGMTEDQKIIEKYRETKARAQAGKGGES